MSTYHKSVLLQEILDFLDVTPGQKYIDATLGGGGHTREILKRGGIVLGIDQDQDAIDFVNQELISKNLTLVKANFNNLQTIAKDNGFEKVAGILMDLGVSSHQLDSVERGFSFMHNASLDMRMDKDLSIGAKELVNGLTRKELEELFKKYGEDPNAWRIAKAIDDKRKEKSIVTTGELASLIERTVGRRGKIHPATKVFQAIRMAVNDEIYSLEQVLPQAIELLQRNGRLVVISFHSLEDRIVKQQFLDFKEKGWGEIITDKPIVPSLEEESENPRSRSAKLRVFKKI